MPVDPSLVGREFPAPAPLTVTADRVARLRRRRRRSSDGGSVPADLPDRAGLRRHAGLPRRRADRPAPHRPRRAALRLRAPAAPPGDELSATLTVTGLRQIGGADIIGTTSEITDADRRRRLHRQGHPRPLAEAPHEHPDAGDVLEPQDLHDHPRRPRGLRRRERRPQPDPPGRGVARSVGLPGVIAHGMYTLALVGRAVAEWTGGAEVVDLGCEVHQPRRRARRGRRRGRGRPAP